MNELKLQETLEQIGSASTQPLCIEVSAGTGKTYTLERLVLGYILKAGIELPKILVLTYTEAATQELKERIRSRLEDMAAARPEGLTLADLLQVPLDGSTLALVRNALASFDQSSIHTIHGFCLGILRDFPLELGMVKVGSDMDAASERRARILQDTLINLLYGDGANDMDRFGADLILEDFAGRISSDPMLTLVQKISSWLDSSYDDPYLYKLDLGAWESCGAWLASGTAGQELRQVAYDFARSGRSILKALGLHDSMAIGAGLLKTMGITYRGAVGDYKNLQELVQWCESKEPFHRWICGIPKPLQIHDFANGTMPRISSKIIPFYAEARDHGATLSSDWGSLAEALTSFEHAVATRLGYSGMVNQVLTASIDKNAEWIFSSIPVVGFFAKASSRVAKAIHDLRYNEGLIDFAGMIDMVHGGLQSPTSPLLGLLSSRWGVLLVDEFQDTDSKQWDIFRRLFAGKPMVLVGDPKQAIYSFRGADVSVYRAVMESMMHKHPGSMTMLGTNHRSSQSIVAGTNFLFSRLRRADLFPHFVPVGVSEDKQTRLGKLFGKETLGRGANHLVQVPSKRSLAAWATWILGEIGALLAEGIDPGDITILCNQNRDGAFLQRFLLGEGIPTRLRGRGSLAVSAQADTLQHLCNAMAKPGSIPELKAFGLSLLGGSTSGSLNADLDLVLGSRIHRITGCYEEHGFIPALEMAVAEQEASIARSDEGRRILTDLFQLAELFDRRVRASNCSVERLGFAMADFLSTLRSEDQHSLELDREDPAVSIMTMHASKGLEFPVVFLVPKMSTRDSPKRYPASFKRNQERTLGFGAHPADRPLMDEMEKQNAMTLFYVAMTRATWRQYLPLIASPKNVHEWFSATLDILELEKIGKHVVKLSPAEELEFSMHFSTRTYLDQGHGATGTLPSKKPSSSSMVPLGPPETGAGLESRPPKARFPRQSSYSRLAEKALSTMSHGVPYSKRQQVVQEADPLPAGKDFGLFVHDIFETWDFGELRRHCNEAIAEGGRPQGELFTSMLRMAKVWGFRHQDLASWYLALLTMIKACLDLELELGDGRVVLGDLDAASLRKEADFTLAIPGSGACIRSPRVLGVLSLTEPLVVPRGFLNGSIDLLLVYQGAIHVLDWKTNRLVDYSTPTLEAAMDEHLYKLQAMIYLAVARARFPQAQVGRAHYLFVRGQGMFTLPVDVATLDALLADLQGIHHDSPGT